MFFSSYRVHWWDFLSLSVPLMLIIWVPWFKQSFRTSVLVFCNLACPFFESTSFTHLIICVICHMSTTLLLGCGQSLEGENYISPLVWIVLFIIGVLLQKINSPHRLFFINIQATRAYFSTMGLDLTFNGSRLSPSDFSPTP